MKNLSGQIKINLPYFPIVVLMGYFLYLSSSFPLHDFSNAYYGALLLQKKLFSATVYDAWFFNNTINQLGQEGLYLAYYPNTPFLAFFFQPLAALDPWLAKYVWNLLSCILLLVSWLRLSHFFQLSARVTSLFPLLFFLCLRNNILFGQVYFLLFFCLSEGLLAYQKGNKRLAAVLWSWSIMMKVFPIVLVLLLLAKRDFKSLGYLLITVVAWLILSLWSVDWSDWMYYFIEVFPKSSSGAYYNGFTAASKSLSMFLRMLFLYDPQFNPQAVYPSYVAFVLVSALLKSLIITPLLLRTWANKYAIDQLLPLWMIAAMLLSPGWSSYAAVLLLFAFGAIWSSKASFSTTKKIIISILILLYCNLPAAYFYDLVIWFQFPKVYLLMLIYCLMFLDSKPCMSHTRRGVVPLLWLLGLFIALGYQKKYRPNQYALDKQTPLLLGDFYEKEGYLEYQYWDIKGIKTKRTNQVMSQFESKQLGIQDHQIYFNGRPLTSDASRKRKPVMVNDSTIFYLSDHHRGMGFYTLMRLSIAPNQN